MRQSYSSAVPYHYICFVTNVLTIYL